MATASSVGQLYAGITQLAYTESRMAITPLIPFTPADANRLGGQSKELAELAIALHSRDPSQLDQAVVNNANAHIPIAQAMFDTINQNSTNSLTVDLVFGTSDAAIAAIKNVLK